MILASILYFALLLIIIEHIPNLLTYKNKFKSNKYIIIQMLITNNEQF